MNRRNLPELVVLLLLVPVLCPPPERADACAVAPPRGQNVAIADESAIILWDAAAKTEHFIRRASFQTEAAKFGFLVPTPTKPELAEADDASFAELATITAPKEIFKTRPAGGGGCYTGCGSAAPRGMAPGAAADKAEVRVLDEKRVAGHDATVLEADDANALSKWLGDHGFEYSPALTEWVAPYVKAGWKITAFQFAKDAKEAKDAREAKDDPDAKKLASSAVRMTFKTDRPFYPYREPASQAAAAGNGPFPQRLLRVYFVGDRRMEGSLGEKGEAWPGKVAWTNRLENASRDKVLSLLKLPAQTPPATWWLTEFEDHSSPRPGTADVFFAPSENQQPVERAPIIHYVSNAAVDGVLWYGCVACVALPYLIGRWRRKATAPRPGRATSGRG
jgi:hypothetical protein